jgi:peroxiredoxin
MRRPLTLLQYWSLSQFRLHFLYFGGWTLSSFGQQTPVSTPRKARRWLKITAYTLALVFVLWLGFVDFIWRAMHRTPEQFGQVMMHMPWEVFLIVPFETLWTRARAGTVQIGDPAPDFTLMKLDKSGTVQFSDLNRVQPVVLIFGSYTWPPFRREVPALNKLYDQYQGKVAFLVVYITEAHPSDVWQMQSNVKEKVVFASPKSEDERASIAGACVRKLGIKIPAVLDEFGNSTEQAYTGWPDRMYLVDQSGRVAYKSRPGPFGFSAEELGKALAKLTQATHPAS